MYVFYIFILMTDSDYSQEVNKINEHGIFNDHSFITTLKIFVVFKRLSIFQLWLECWNLSGSDDD